MRNLVEVQNFSSLLYPLNNNYNKNNKNHENNNNNNNNNSNNNNGVKKFYCQQCQLLKSYLQLIRLKKRKTHSFKTLFTIPVDLKSP